MSRFFERLEEQLQTAAEAPPAGSWARLRTRWDRLGTRTRAVPTLAAIAVTICVVVGIAVVASTIGSHARHAGGQGPVRHATTTTSGGGSPECNTSAGNPPQLHEGPCVLNGSSFVMVNKASTVHLKSLDAHLVGFHPDGKFTSSTITITNNLRTPQRWQYTMAALYIAGENTGSGYGPFFLENLGAETNDQNSCLWKTGTAAHGGLQAGQSMTCDVVFDLPATVHLSGRGNGLYIANFGDDVSITSHPVGIIRTYH
jgi:hypothetical protein